MLAPPVQYARTDDGVAIAYAERGGHTLRGIEEPQQLFALRWRAGEQATNGALR